MTTLSTLDELRVRFMDVRAQHPGLPAVETRTGRHSGDLGISASDASTTPVEDVDKVEEALAASGWRTFREEGRPELVASPPGVDAQTQACQVLADLVRLAVWDQYGKVRRSGVWVKERGDGGVLVTWRAKELPWDAQKPTEHTLMIERWRALGAAEALLLQAGWTVEIINKYNADPRLSASTPEEAS